jgi:hypothetical protein
MKSRYLFPLMALLALNLVLTNKIVVAASQRDQSLKQLADRWGWNVTIEEAGRLDQLMGKFSKQYKLKGLHPVIEEEVHKAFKACNITEPVLVLQDDNSSDSACYGLLDEQWYPVKAMVIGVGGAPLPLIRYAIFHECGHIVAGDVNRNLTKKDLAFTLALLSASTYSGIRVAKALKNFPRFVLPIGVIGAAITSAFAFGRIYNKTIEAYQTRKIERNADTFAAQQLIKAGDYNSLAYQVLDFTYNCDEGKFNWKNEYWFFHDHPGYLERARSILDELKKVPVDLKNLPIDESEHPDKCSTQQKFTAQVEKYFPEYLNS